MRLRSVRVRLWAVLLSGLVLGALGLFEPLIGFWGNFHLLGVRGTTLILYYLGIGLAIAIAAAIPVTLGLARRPLQWLPVAVTAYYATATAALATAIVLAPVVRWEFAGFHVNLSYAIIFPVLLAAAAFLTYKSVPRLFHPLFGRWIGQPSGRIAGPKLAILLVLVGLLIPITLWKDAQSRFPASGRPPRAELATRPNSDAIQNVLLITVDALRADHLQCYGYARATSPNIDRLAAQGALFTQAYAQGNCTELSMASIFTSLYPSLHGVQRRAGAASRLPDAIETLPEQMREAGLTTYGLLANPYLKREWGLTQGFDQVEEFHYGYRGLLPVKILSELGLLKLPELIAHLDMPRARVVIDEAIRICTASRGRPFFLHLHLMDAHHPYVPPAEYQDDFPTPGASATGPAQLWRRGWPIFEMLPSQQSLLQESDLKRIIDLYDGSIRYVDDEIGRLLGTLDRLGLAANTLVVLTADHGDEFLEHGDIFHKSKYLYDELIHVPLVVRVPGESAGRRFDTLVRHIDIFPTLVDYLGLPRYAGAEGRSLRPLLTGAGEWTELPVFSQSYECVAVRTATHKLMYDLRQEESLCFDLGADPGEHQNVYDTNAACAALDPVLMEFLKHISLPPSGQPPIEIDTRTRRALESIGYIDF
jgi:arylsulfatase A-like enzyme